MKRVGTSDFDKPRVLLVDDEAAFAAMLRYNLETRGFLVEHAANGQQALSRTAKFQPHVVLLDWTLPGMCGFEVCRRLRSRPETKDVGVIMVTARAGDQNAVRGLDAGADDYVVKPLSITELLARIWALPSENTGLSREEMPTIARDGHRFGGLFGNAQWSEHPPRPDGISAP
jgi:two-component system phosphate regulon response regulator PhoB